ncbi:18726_t:CDS:2, partial [Gigaspora rosea]
MPKLSKQKRHLTYSRSQRNEIQKISKIITQIDHESLPKIRQILTNITKKAKEEEMFQTIRDMPEPQKTYALKLFNSMRYPRGKHVNEIISPYLQKKALDIITNHQKSQINNNLIAENAELKSTNKKLKKSNEKLIHKIQSISSSNRHLQNKVNNRISTIRSLWLLEPTECELKLAQQLREDFETTNDTFGLQEELLGCLEFQN